MERTVEESLQERETMNCVNKWHHEVDLKEYDKMQRGQLQSTLSEKLAYLLAIGKNGKLRLYNFNNEL